MTFFAINEEDVDILPDDVRDFVNEHFHAEPIFRIACRVGVVSSLISETDCEIVNQLEEHPDVFSLNF